MNIVWHWPQIVLVGLFALRVLNCSAHHGEPDGTKNAGASVIAALLMMVVLYYGGFFAGATP